MKDKKHKHEKIDYKLMADENLAGWQKALADYQNLQKETDKRLKDLSIFVRSDIILQLLPIFDNYQTAINHIPKDQKNESWAVGLEHILRMWDGFLNERNVKKIKAVGEKFDANLHESVGQVSDDKNEDHIIVEEKQIGYKIDNMVIRPAKVIINNI
ncbi:nucleotide exchange factor GrpE [Patescibacteria group bacterium]|nr:nucleotide exchange factor GrpE [Patescibacteria group bacterium]